MSTYDDASLVFYPSGYKASKAYSLKPTDGSGDLTFTRASTATRVNEQGLIETAGVISPTELIANGDFATDTSWTKIGSTISGGQATFPANGTNILLFQTASPSISVGSIVKLDYEIISNSLSDGTLRTGGIGSSDISDIINLESSVGIHSLYITARAGSSSRIMLWISSTSGTLVIDNVSVKEVITNNVPRIDYTGGGCGKLLLEPQRTNYITYSNYDASTWTQTTASISINSATSPDGTTNAHTATRTSGSNQRIGIAAFSATVGQPYTNSIYLRKVSGSGLVRLIDINNTATTFTLTTEWVRYSVTAIAIASTQRLYVEMTEDGDVIEFWQGQIENGSYSTSLIPTTTTAVTRVADVAGKSGISSLIGQTEGVLFAEIEKLADGTWYLTLSDGTVSNWVFIGVDGGNLRGYVRTSAGVQVDNSSTLLSNGIHKIAIAYKFNDVAIYLDGSQVFTTSSASVPSVLDRLNLSGAGVAVPSSQSSSGVVKQYLIFPTRLSNAELAALTTL